MLQLLSLKDFVIVPKLNIEAEKGLTCLTGETGAGKSILIDALQLVLGGRSDTNVIRQGADRTEVCAEFSLTTRAKSWLEAADINCDDEIIILRRTLDVKGRSRAWINGTPATIAQLRELGERLVDIHGQHAHQSLLKPTYQLQLVDGFGATRALRIAVRDAWLNWQHHLRLLTEASEDKEKLQAESERLTWILEILDELSPQENEWEKISKEHDRLSNSTDIVSSVRAALENLRDGNDNASALITRAQNELNHAAKYDPTCAEFETSLQTAITIVDDTARDISHHLDRFDIDEDEFQAIDDRLNQFWRLSRKFKRTPEELHGFWQETRQRLAQIHRSADLDALTASEREAYRSYEKVANQLTEARRTAAQALAARVTQEMQNLSMAGGQLVIDLPSCEPWAGGLERCEFLVSGHAGAEPRSLTKVASGGELARISLAIAVITAQITPVPTLIFDEVDSGIGGAVAEVVGRLLRRLGTSRQVLCVTHLPQVAACANNQWLVQKQTQDGVTTSNLTLLNNQQRITEIARMMGGLVITESTLQTAAELIDSAKHADQLICDSQI